WKVPPTGGQARRNKLLVSWGPLVARSFEMRCTVPVPMPSDLATLKIPTPFASCCRTFRSVALSIFGRPNALGDGALETCLYPFANHRPLEFRKGAGFSIAWSEGVEAIFDRKLPSDLDRWGGGYWRRCY